MFSRKLIISMISIQIDYHWSSDENETINPWHGGSLLEKIEFLDALSGPLIPFQACMHTQNTIRNFKIFSPQTRTFHATGINTVVKAFRATIFSFSWGRIGRTVAYVYYKMGLFRSFLFTKHKTELFWIHLTRYYVYCPYQLRYSNKNIVNFEIYLLKVDF